MIRLFRRIPAGRPGRRRRVVLRLEGFDRRETPTGNLTLSSGTISATGNPTPVTGDSPPASTDCPPEIVNFTAVPGANGWYVISGQVIDEHPGGLTVFFGGDVATMDGQSTTTAADGTFRVAVWLNPNGTDTGWLTAVTQDNAGQSSNVASVYVRP